VVIIDDHKWGPLRVICENLTFFLGGVDVARRRDVGRFHLKVRLEVYPESFFFLRGEKGVLVSKSFVKGWTNELSYIRPVTDGFQCP